MQLGYIRIKFNACDGWDTYIYKERYISVTPEEEIFWHMLQKSFHGLLSLKFIKVKLKTMVPCSQKQNVDRSSVGA